MLKQYVQDHGKILSQANLEYFQCSYKQHHCVPMFYSMPKLHKTPFSTRPIISCINSFGAIFSTWLDYQMKQIVPFIPAYLPDLNTLLTDLKNIADLPHNAKIFTADAVSMYTIIDTMTGVQAFQTWFEVYSHELLHDFPCLLFIKVLEYIMRNNVFQFDNTHWLQL